MFIIAQLLDLVSLTIVAVVAVAALLSKVASFYYTTYVISSLVIKLEPVKTSNFLDSSKGLLLDYKVILTKSYVNKKEEKLNKNKAYLALSNTKKKTKFKNKFKKLSKQRYYTNKSTK
ncbi:hypothetical protein FB567DRAFT_548034 [Paraphoma chrysanthemicola]|uniref:Uncharacterized protein n=1 Tax=Paraphoma chrysanthemicola TaxID=798071 RepID=A0A8K0W0Z1_9PLEO|nr:hypothetical protein FB567DRAFT_548034 [Paraphoma chrysanthemicola]